MLVTWLQFSDCFFFLLYKCTVVGKTTSGEAYSMYFNFLQVITKTEQIYISESLLFIKWIFERSHFWLSFITAGYWKIPMYKIPFQVKWRLEKKKKKFSVSAMSFQGAEHFSAICTRCLSNLDFISQLKK